MRRPLADLTQMLDAGRRLLLWPLQATIELAGDGAAIRDRNLKNLVKGRAVRFGYDNDRRLFFVTEGQQRHFFANWQRGARLYSQGIEHRGRMLWETYKLDHIKFEPDDVVVDCGANYGDLWITLRTRIKPENYIAFEPGSGEFATVKANAAQSCCNAMGLGNKVGVARFYMNDAEADSSLIEPSRYTSVVEIQTTTLDSFLQSRGITAVKLLKLEAEGLEPEVLEGAADSLSMIQYVALDGGNERGVSEEETFSRCANVLYSRGFQLVEMNFRWSRGLFARRTAR